MTASLCTLPRRAGPEGEEKGSSKRREDGWDDDGEEEGEGWGGEGNSGLDEMLDTELANSAAAQPLQDHPQAAEARSMVLDTGLDASSDAYGTPFFSSAAKKQPEPSFPDSPVSPGQVEVPHPPRRQESWCLTSACEQMGEIPLNSPQADEELVSSRGGGGTDVMPTRGLRMQGFNFNKVKEGLSKNVNSFGITDKVGEVWQRSSAVRDKITAVTKDVASAVQEEIAGELSTKKKIPRALSARR